MNQVNQIRVLAVDDDDSVLRGIASLVETDFTCDTADGVTRAITALGNTAYDVVLLDLRMPMPETQRSEPEAGLLVLDHIRRQALDVEVIILTALAGKEYFDLVVQAMEKGAFSYVQKRPEELQTLKSKILLASERKRARIALADKERLIGRMASQIVHDIRNPLLVIGGNAELARMSLEKSTPGTDCEQYLSEISFHVQKLNMMADEIVDCAKGFPATPHVSNSSLRDFIKRLRGDLELLCAGRDKNIELEVGSMDSMPEAMLTIDSDRMNRVFWNLVRNAAEAFAEVVREEKKIEVATVLDGAYVNITVKDNGPGMDPERVKDLFDIAKSLERPGGRGLGLQISREIVEAHGGQLLVGSVPGQGTTFTVRLPCEVGNP